MVTWDGGGWVQTFALNEQFQNTAGTPAFFAPEMCKGISYAGVPTDLWALGITLCVPYIGYSLNDI